MKRYVETHPVGIDVPAGRDLPRRRGRAGLVRAAFRWAAVWRARRAMSCNSRWGIALGLAAVAMSAALGGCGSSSTTPSLGTVSVASVRVRTVQTKLGSVAYRVFGSGPLLVMIMGYAGTMEVWDPRFVDDLANRFRVVIFDNAGVGRTQALPAPLTIDAMADQTSALINALGLGRPNVLGWSMGSMIAEALAIRHPSQVRRLLLCAAFPGNGTVARPSQTEIDALTSGNQPETAAALFPHDRSVAYSAYAADSSAYPPAPPAPAAIVAAQARAVTTWWDGSDPAGKRTANISAPTLIADGTVDRIDPLSNSRALGKLIPTARLVLYPDAGHAFLFQDPTTVAFAIKSFLTGAPKPVSTSVMRTRFLSSNARVDTAGKTWDSKLKALHSAATSAQVANIAQPYATALAQLEEQLLSFGTTGRLKDEITNLVDADEKLTDDVLALSVTTGSILPTWEATIKRDANTDRTAEGALRRPLGLPPAH
jgi:pimeloyl-ACP methyl ester carboxylesterase